MSRGEADVIAHLHDHGVDLKRRRVFLFAPIKPTWDQEDLDFGSSDRVVKNLLWLDESEGPIQLWINTPGGCLDEMWAIYDVMRNASNDVETIAVGEVASAGCLLLAGGTDMRRAMPNSTFMWHSMSHSCGALLTQELYDRVEFTRKAHDRWIDEMARQTHPPGCRSLASRRAFWEKWSAGREKYMDAKDMLRHKIVDRIYP